MDITLGVGGLAGGERETTQQPLSAGLHPSATQLTGHVQRLLATGPGRIVISGDPFQAAQEGKVP